MNDWDMETEVVSMAAPTTSVWAVFTAEEGDDGEIWTERVHLWARTRTALPQERAAEEQFLENDVPPASYEIQGMVICEGDLVLVKDAGDWLFLGYSENSTPPAEDWKSAVKLRRRLLAHHMAELSND